MKSNSNRSPRAEFRISAIALAVAMSMPAFAETSARSPAQDGPIDEIIVTAQKREQSINDVPLTLTAASGEALEVRGVLDPGDLGKIVPGFTFQPAATGIPVYSLRGVGYYDEALAASPAVAMYVDEVPLPFSIMASGAMFDLERVEVLKGPQGTLFGQNSTGGAINYVAAKPTDTYQAGASLGYARFDTVDLQGYVSGPLGDGVNARLAVRNVTSGNWQKSYTRNDELGKQDLTQMRLLVDLKPSDKLKIALNLNGWIDKGDTQAPQVIAITPQNPAGMLPYVASFPIAPEKSRAADWTIGRDFKKDDSFYQLSGRVDYDLSDKLTLTSITAYQEMKRNAVVDGDGTPFENVDLRNYGFIDSFNQEVRLAANLEKTNIIIGGNYEYDRTKDHRLFFVADASNREIIPGIVHDGAELRTRQKISTVALFGNIETALTDQWSALAGVRYTKQDRSADMCSADAGNHNIRLSFTVIQSLFQGHAVPTIPPFGCLTFDQNYNPGPVHGTLDEHNVSWRAGLNWRPNADLLVYGNVSKGYKSGSFPTIFATSLNQDKPVTQESLLAYETGFKWTAGHVMQLNGAAFYYDYKDKQLLGKALDPSFGVLQALVNIPKSSLYGAELEATLRPIDRLVISAAATYVHSKIEEYVGLTSTGLPQDLAGSEFPYAPKWQMVSDAQYNWPLSASLGAFVGGGLTHNSATNGGIGNDPLLRIQGYTTADLRAGLEDPKGAWRLTFWGRNIGDKYYWTNAQRTQDTTLRLAGRPRTYGVTLALSWK